MAKKRSSKKLPIGMCEIGLKIPRETVAMIRSEIKFGKSVSGMIREVIEDVFGEGKPAPAELGTLVPQTAEEWPRIAVYCSEKTRDRGLQEVQRRGLDRTGATKPRGVAPAIAWLLVQKYGPTEIKLLHKISTAAIL